MAPIAAHPILTHHVPDAARLWGRARSLPGISPLAPDDWLWLLDSYSAQMAERERLLRLVPDKVLAMSPGAAPAVAELYEMICARLAGTPGYTSRGTAMACPDGREVALDPMAPLGTLGRLVAEDLCILQRPEGGAEHVLSAAVLCFPTNWTLAEKIGRPMVRIHKPVEPYDDMLARRVQRLMDGVKPDRPLWRANFHKAASPALFQPQLESEKWPIRRDGGFYRSERQCLLRLPRTGALVFSIHTMVLDHATMSEETRAALPR